MPKIVLLSTYVLTALSVTVTCYFVTHLYFALLMVLLSVVATWDFFQSRHSILRNYPLLGHLRFLLESIRPEIQQYFIESYENGKPFSREMRSVVYERAKGIGDNLPFGTQQDLYRVGNEWLEHSIHPAPFLEVEPRIRIGGAECTKPYMASCFNVSAMSYGSLGRNAILALGLGAKRGQFYLNTGEGGLTEHHLASGASIVWQIGTGYFGCRDANGRFHHEHFATKARHPNIAMIEIKISQGAKPGHGGILPGTKVTEEIAKIRQVPAGQTVVSPGGHTAFSTPHELCTFIKHLRRGAEGKPIGIKLCIGKRVEFLAICKAMLETNILPDFITVDGAEGGTGAAPYEFLNDMGTPLTDALVFVHNALVGSGLREKIRVIASGKVISGFDIATKLAAGADLCNSARGMMFAIGCIQALRCHTNKCPTGVATQDPLLERGLVVGDKSVRVENYHRNTVKAFLGVLAATGKTKPADLGPMDVKRRMAPLVIKNYAQIFGYLETRDLLNARAPDEWRDLWDQASARQF